MPFIHVKSLPLETALDVRSVVERLSRDFSEGTGIGIEHITVTWEFLHPHHYAAGGRTCSRQTAASHPVLVDLLAPDFNTQETIERMLHAVASSIAKHTKIDPGNIFINYRTARSGMVFDGGKIERW